MNVQLEMDDKGRIVLEPAVRAVVERAVADMWPGTDPDEFLDRRIGQLVPASVALTVRIAQAAVRAADCECGNYEPPPPLIPGRS